MVVLLGEGALGISVHPVTLGLAIFVQVVLINPIRVIVMASVILAVGIGARVCL